MLLKYLSLQIINPSVTIGMHLQTLNHPADHESTLVIFMLRIKYILNTQMTDGRFLKSVFDPSKRIKMKCIATRLEL